ncbi:MAG TPA: radical SAM family heme chaperone HemW [Vicinamibacterales bacterium]|nr:radical SAM family heme chaperone HemW [Vicinamibacterales bacterium]
MLGLYLHIPFCAAICNYCNFNRGLFDAELKGRYVDALIAEIDRAGALGEAAAADTIFFGGGTPSLLEPSEIARIIEACERAVDIAADREVTIEANPETVTTARLRGYRDAGVNRVSFGVQSFREDELKRLSRLHTADRARSAVREARAAGFDNVSLDLMMWLPEQRLADWLESVDAAIAAGPDHLSLYLLELYPNAPLRDEMARARWSQAPDEDAEAMYLTAMERLDAAGYAQYEISNVAKPGRESRHNLKYWQDGEWVGFGCGAHSTRGGVRWKNVSATEEYIQRVQRGEPTRTDERRLPPDERLGDALFTGLRLSEGVDLAAVRHRYAVDVWERYGSQLEGFLDAGCLVHEGTRLRLTRRGMLLAHEVMAVFV